MDGKFAIVILNKCMRYNKLQSGTICKMNNTNRTNKNWNKHEIRLCNFVHSGKSMVGYAWSLWPKACSIHYFYQTDTESLVWLRVSKGPIQVHRNRIVAIRRRTTKCTFNDLNLVRSGCRSIRCIRVWWRLQSWLQSWLQPRPREKEICTYIGRTRGLFTASIFAFVSAHYTLYTVRCTP